MTKISKDFYQQPALEIVKDFLGKYLVYESPKGKVAGKIIDVEAYPAFTDKVSHANKRTARTEVTYGEGGYAYVYLIYGIYHQFAVVVNKKDVPEVVFIRAVIPTEGIEIMQENYGKPVKKVTDLTKSPGNLCKSMGITLDLYGEDITDNKLYIENRGEVIDPANIQSVSRVGISSSLEGHDQPLRFFIKPSDII